MADTRYTRDYFCTRCGKKTDRADLVAKKAVFTTMGSRAKTHKSRVVAYLCNRATCLPADADWNIEPYSEPEYEKMPEGFEEEPTAESMNDSEGRPPGHPQYCGEGCLHVNHPAPDGSIQEELPLEPVHLLGR